MPKLKGTRFATAIIERCKRRKTSVEEAMIEKYLAGASTRRIEDVSEILRGSSVSAATVSNLNGKAFKSVEERRGRPGIYLKRAWGGSFENVAAMVAIGVNDDGYCEAIHAQESLDASMEKAAAASLDEMRLAAAAKCVREGAAETPTCTRFPMRRWRRIRASNAIERPNRKIRRRTRVAGTFPDGKSASCW